MLINWDNFLDNEFDSNKMLEIANQDIYSINSFRILGLPTTATNRELDKQQKKISILYKLGTDISSINSGYLPVNPPPNTEIARAAMQRIYDPENRIIDEMFWFWPLDSKNASTDQPIRLLQANDLNGARSYWAKYVQDKHLGYLAIHNLAILFHLKALEAEIEYIAKKPSLKSDLSVFWQKALQYWHLVCENEQFWQHITNRIKSLDDPRVSDETVSKLRNSLPKVLVAIGVQLDFSNVLIGNQYESRRHRKYLSESGFDQKLYSNILDNLLWESVEKIVSNCEENTLKAKSNPLIAADIAERCYSDNLSNLNNINSIVDIEHYLRKKANSSIAKSMRDCYLIYWEITKDVNRCLRLTDLAKNIAGDSEISSQINNDLINLKEIKEDIKKEKENEILQNDIDKGFVYKVTYNSTEFLYPVFCTCCLKETENKQAIMPGGVLGGFNSTGIPISFPICDECINHQNEFQNKKIVILFLSVFVSITILALLRNATNIFNSQNWLLSIPVVFICVYSFSRIIKLRDLSKGHACRSKAVEIQNQSTGKMVYIFHNPLYASSFARANKVNFNKSKSKKPSRDSYILHGKGKFVLFILAIFMYMIIAFIIFQTTDSPNNKANTINNNISSKQYSSSNVSKETSLVENIEKGKALASNMEAELIKLKEESNALSINIDKLKKRIDIFELAISQREVVNQHLYQTTINEHNDLVQRYNSVQEDIEEKHNLYSLKIDSVNKMIKRYNMGDR